MYPILIGLMSAAKVMVICSYLCHFNLIWWYGVFGGTYIYRWYSFHYGLWDCG